MYDRPLSLRDLPRIIAGWFGFMAALVGVGLLAWLLAAIFKHIGLWGEAANLAGIIAAIALVLWVGTRFWR
jgi:hypothetical protein